MPVLMWLAAAAFCVYLAKETGKSRKRWLLIGVVFGPFAAVFFASILLLDILFLEDSETSQASGWMNTVKGRRSALVTAIAGLAIWGISLAISNATSQDSTTGSQAEAPSPRSTLSIASAITPVQSVLRARSPSPDLGAAILLTASTPPETPTPTSTPIPIQGSTLAPTTPASPIRTTATTTPVPTATPVPTPTPTPAPVIDGRSRSNPFPFGSAATVPNWTLKVLRVIRGEEASRILHEVKSYIHPSAQEQEYVLVELNAIYTGTGEGQISAIRFAVTGSSGVLRPAFNINPSSSIMSGRILDATLLNGGAIRGWIALGVYADESDLILVFSADSISVHGLGSYLFSMSLFGLSDPAQSSGIVDIGDEYYIALDPDASVYYDDSSDTHMDTELGKKLDQPVPFGERASAGGFQVEIVEVIKGDAAWAMLESSSKYAVPPDSGMEYILAKIRVEYSGTDDQLIAIGNDAFRTVGEKRVVHDGRPHVLWAQQFGAVLYPGSVHEGWVVLQSIVGERDLVVIYDPPSMSRNADQRYLDIP